MITASVERQSNEPAIVAVQDDRFLTTKEASLYLSRSISWFERARLEGNGPKFYKDRNSVRYLKSDLHKWMQSGAVQSTAEYKTHQSPPIYDKNSGRYVNRKKAGRVEF